MWLASIARQGVLLIAVAALSSQHDTQSPREPRVPTTHWRSQGYGLAVSLSDSSMRVWEMTAGSCIDGWRARRVATSPEGDTFARDDDPSTTLVVRVEGQHASLRYPGAASAIPLLRAASRPLSCSVPASASSQAVFDVFWQTFAENYPFFEARHVDWQAVRNRLRPAATDSLTPRELFARLQDALAPLHDAHTFVVGPDSGMQFGGWRDDPAPLVRGDGARIRRIVSGYLTGPPRLLAASKLAYGRFRDGSAYLEVREFEGMASTPGFLATRDAFEAALDTVFSDARGWRGLVIDVRLNPGGSDVLGLALAARLASAPYVAYRKVARADPTSPRVFTAPQPSGVVPSARPGYRGPVALLLSRYSASAAETFAQAMMGRRPRAAFVGEASQGVFSDVLSRRLPNGWTFGLPNELFLDASARSFDVTGIPPTIPAPVFTREEIDGGRDSALNAALAWIARRPFPASTHAEAQHAPVVPARENTTWRSRMISPGGLRGFPAERHAPDVCRCFSQRVVTAIVAAVEPNSGKKVDVGVSRGGHPLGLTLVAPSLVP